VEGRRRPEGVSRERVRVRTQSRVGLQPHLVRVNTAASPEFGLDLEHLMACADAALYRSKARGKAQVQFCEPDAYREAERAVA